MLSGILDRAIARFDRLDDGDKDAFKGKLSGDRRSTPNRGAMPGRHGPSKLYQFSKAGDYIKDDRIPRSPRKRCNVCRNTRAACDGVMDALSELGATSRA